MNPVATNTTEKETRRASMDTDATRFAKSTVRGVGKNIDTKDRLFRLVIALALLGFAITTTWSPIILFLAGFSLFQAIVSWCGFYAAIGRNSCPIN